MEIPPDLTREPFRVDLVKLVRKDDLKPAGMTD